MEHASIKKIDFKFNNLMHSALVSISGTSDNMFVHIQLINSFLRKVFGVEHIRFSKQHDQINVLDAKHPAVYQIAQLVSLELVEEFQKTGSSGLRIV